MTADTNPPWHALKTVQLQLGYQGQRLERRFLLTTGLQDDLLDASVERETVEPGGFRFRLVLSPKVPLVLERVWLELPLADSSPNALVLNGYQSWTDTAPRPPSYQTPRLRWPLRPLLRQYGDYNFGLPRVSQRGWSYGCLHWDDHALWIGELPGRQAFLRLEWDAKPQMLRLEADCTGRGLHTEAFMAFDFWMGIAPEPEAERTLAERWLAHYPAAQPAAPATGWTSWYQHYTRISEAIVQDNLRAYQQAQVPLDYFQIDDGWQPAVGDWLEHNSKFGNGMNGLVGDIRHAGSKPGLWLAPFIVDSRSEILRRHSDWLLRDPQGQPVRAGFNPLWGGWLRPWFYALNIYHPAVQAYLSRVFAQVQGWGFALVKLDFLYAAALQPPPNRTRAEVMDDAMQMLRQWCDPMQILGCGVQLQPSIGTTDFCRIGSDVAPYWEDPMLSRVHYRERVSTVNSLRSTLGRWVLQGRAFANDPDVFILRPKTRLSTREQRTLFRANCLLGGLVFTSDNIDQLEPAQRELYLRHFPHRAWRILAVQQPKTDVFRVDFEVIVSEDFLPPIQLQLWVNLSDRPVDLKPTECTDLDAREPTVVYVPLQPHESRLLLVPSAQTGALIWASDGHLFPGGDIEELTLAGDTFALKRHPHARYPAKYWLLADDRALKMNGKLLPRETILGRECWQLTLE